MIKIELMIHMDEDERIDCPTCGTTHRIKLEDIAVTVGECEDCEYEIIIAPNNIDKGTKQ